MKREDLIKGLSRTLSIARIAKERDVKQSEIIELINKQNEELNELYSNYYSEFIGVFNQL